LSVNIDFIIDFLFSEFTRGLDNSFFKSLELARLVDRQFKSLIVVSREFFVANSRNASAYG
jgi:hypothetical protein